MPPPSAGASSSALGTNSGFYGPRAASAIAPFGAGPLAYAPPLLPHPASQHPHPHPRFGFGYGQPLGAPLPPPPPSPMPMPLPSSSSSLPPYAPYLGPRPPLFGGSSSSSGSGEALPERHGAGAAAAAALLAQAPAMAVYAATEKDCVSADGAPCECVICLEEFAVGDELGLLECFCKFHRRCIVEWYEKGSGVCPTHKVIGGGGWE